MSENKVTRRKANTDFVLADTVVPPGSRALIDLPVADLYTHSSLKMPIQVVNGKQAGPVLFVSAAIHGDELNGVEIIRRLLKHKSLGRLRGTLIAVPVVNVHGFLDQSRYLPDRRDLNRSFPGSSKGSLASRLADVFSKEIIDRADYGIDLHTGSAHRENLPQIRANLDDETTMRLANTFDVPVILNAPVRDGSLRGYAAEKGIPTLLYEAGEALRFSEVGIRAGLRGILGAMRELEMLAPSKRRRTTAIDSQVATSSQWARAPYSGVVRSAVKLGDRVAKGQTLAMISDPFGEEEFEVNTQYSGIIIGQSKLPLAYEGDALFHIARFDSNARAEDTVEEFRTIISPDSVPESVPE